VGRARCRLIANDLPSRCTPSWVIATLHPRGSLPGFSASNRITLAKARECSNSTAPKIRLTTIPPPVWRINLRIP
jgi:hypothetical protein